MLLFRQSRPDLQVIAVPSAAGDLPNWEASTPTRRRCSRSRPFNHSIRSFAFIVPSVPSFPSGHSSSSSNPAVAPALRAGPPAGNRFPGDNWQHCRSLGGRYDPVPPRLRPVWAGLSRRGTKDGVRRYLQRRGRSNRRSSYSASRCPRRRLPPICRRPANTRKIDSESMTSQRPPNFRVS